jgi:hypothetical protein
MAVISIRGSRGPRASGNRIRMYAGPVTWAIITIGCEFRFVNTNNLLVSANRGIPKTIPKNKIRVKSVVTSSRASSC